MKLPKSINYAEAYLTLNCNFDCDYCINDNDGVERDREELSPTTWANSLNRIDFGDVPLTLGGGEPTQYKGFYDLIDKLDPSIKLNLLTNLQFNVDKFIDKVDPKRFSTTEDLNETSPFYHSIRVSYHANQTNEDKLIDNATKIQDAGFDIGIFGIAYPPSAGDNMNIAYKCSQNNLFFFTKDFLGDFENKLYGHYKYPRGVDKIAKDAMCKSKELLIAPDGHVYRCHSDLYNEVTPVEDIQNDSFHLSEDFRYCDNYGFCNPCDVRNKVNKVTKELECQVTIEEK